MLALHLLREFEFVRSSTEEARGLDKIGLPPDAVARESFADHRRTSGFLLSDAQTRAHFCTTLSVMVTAREAFSEFPVTAIVEVPAGVAPMLALEIPLLQPRNVPLTATKTANMDTDTRG